jgi:hypothetical protein
MNDSGKCDIGAKHENETGEIRHKTSIENKRALKRLFSILGPALWLVQEFILSHRI